MTHERSERFLLFTIWTGLLLPCYAQIYAFYAMGGALVWDWFGLWENGIWDLGVGFN